ncbi:MAG: VanZ family protein [Nitrospirae bacterium]|nr:VanZ family protein [Nitrospirota bacterium]
MSSPFIIIVRKYLGVICLCVITVILFAGLWPKNFHSENDVAFLPDGKGIRYSRRGIIYTKNMLMRRYAQHQPSSLSIEMVIESDKEWNKSVPVILAIDDGQPCERLIIAQWKSTLIIQNRLRNSCQYDHTSQIGIGDTLLIGRSRFIAIASDKRGTAVYIDGQLKEWRRDVSLLGPNKNAFGQLVIGNSADGKRPWTGIVSTLAIYDQALSPEEVQQHYDTWSNDGSISSTIRTLPMALYRFDQQAGSVVRDHSGLGNDLDIPEHFTPLRRRMLVIPWNDFRVNRSYAIDVVINILGFIPFGFFITWYLSEKSVTRVRIVVITMILGIGTSFFIEIIQSYLPARSSQLMDVIGNSGGTMLGITLWKIYFSTLLSARDFQF